MRVITVRGVPRTGVIRSIDVALNSFGIRFDGENKTTIGQDASAFAFSPNPDLRLTAHSPQETVPRSS